MKQEKKKENVQLLTSAARKFGQVHIVELRKNCRSFQKKIFLVLCVFLTNLLKNLMLQRVTLD